MTFNFSACISMVTSLLVLVNTIIGVMTHRHVKGNHHVKKGT